jgi:hypothetical protein
MLVVAMQNMLSYAICFWDKCFAHISQMLVPKCMAQVQLK